MSDSTTAEESDVESEEPSPIGAAATITGTRSRREDRAERRETKRRREAAPSIHPDDESDPDVSIFEPHSGKIPNLRTYVGSLWERRRFLVAVAKADLKGPRSSTALGSLWGLLDPIFQSAIYYFLFVVIRGGEGRPVDFLPLLIAGVFLFKLTSAAMTEGGKSVRKSSGLMLNSAFPRALLPLASVYKGLLAFVPTLVVYVGVYAWWGHGLDRDLLWIPPLFGILVVMNVAIALLMATIIVFFKDAENALQYVTRILFFTTPIIYPVAILPESIRAWLSFQPLYPIFASFQMSLSEETVDPTLVLHGAAWTVGLLVIGSWLFLRFEQKMASRL